MSRLYHPWFAGFKGGRLSFPVNPLPPSEVRSEPPADLSSPILFLARGHSGTTPLARILSVAGVHMGDPHDPRALNRTLDALYWVFGFQRTLLPLLFEPGSGCQVDGRAAVLIALECLRRHWGDSYRGGRWGFKTCAGMFAHPLYRYVFPRAKYIYLLRDGRDIILSGNGFFHLTHPFSRYQHWDYFKMITFGLTGDAGGCPFDLPERPSRNDAFMRNRFWVQARSWREHVRMVEHLREENLLSPDVHTLRYEDLCQDPVSVLGPLFRFLDLELTDEVKDFAHQYLHARSIGKWKHYERHVADCDEEMEAVFASMEPELRSLGYVA
jgi:hypothetical protein